MKMKEFESGAPVPGALLKAINTPRVKRQRQGLIMQVNGDAWEWVGDPFSSVTVYFNVIQSDAPDDAAAAA